MLNSPDGRFNLAFTGYAYRCQQIEDFISLLIEADAPADEQSQRAIADRIGLDPDTLEPDDIEYIEMEVMKRRQ